MKLIIPLCIATASLLSSCSTVPATSCNFGALRLRAQVSITQILKSDRQFIVSASGFTPFAQARLAIHNFPSPSVVEGDTTRTVTVDSTGSLEWKTFAPLTMSTQPDYDPNADVRAMLVEIDSICFAITTVKRREFDRL